MTIDGVQYVTIVIGSQTRTSEDYKDPGAMIFPIASIKDTAYLYTYEQFSAIVPPPGWRLTSASDYSILCNTLGTTFDSRGYGDLVGTPAEVLTNVDWSEVAGNNKSGFNAKPVGGYYSTIPG